MRTDGQFQAKSHNSFFARMKGERADPVAERTLRLRLLRRACRARREVPMAWLTAWYTARSPTSRHRSCVRDADGMRATSPSFSHFLGRSLRRSESEG